MSAENPDNLYESNLDKEESGDSKNSDSNDIEKKETEKLQKGIEQFKTEAEENLRANKFLYESFSDSVTPRLKFSHGVKIDFETMTIHLDTTFFYKNGFTEKQMLWAAYHELAHFKDLISDPERFMENFKHIRAKAEEYGKKIREITGEPEQQFTEEEKKEGKVDPAVAQAYDGWHTFYNCLDDIYVNSLVEKGVYSYSQKGRDYSEISDLYSRVLFQKTDYSNLPKSRQFSYAMLRKAMLPGESLELDPAVESFFQREVKFGGKKMTVEQIIEMIQSKTRRGVKAGSRYFMIQKTLEPIFEELYNQDLKEWQKRREEKEKQDENQQKDEEKDKNDSNSRKDEEQKQEQESQKEDGKGETGNEESGEENSENSNQDNDSAGDSSGQTEEGEPKNLNEDSSEEDGEPKEGNKQEQPESEGEPGGAGDPFDDEFDPKQSKKSKQNPTIPDFSVPTNLDDKDIKKIVDKINQFKQNPNPEQQKPSKEEQKAEQDRKLEEQIQKWCDENDINRETLRRFEEIQAEISPYLSELSKVWDSIIYGRGSKFARQTESSNEGEINVSRFIKYFPDIEAGRMREVRPMDRRVVKQLPADKPETVRVRFVGDASASMFDDPSKHDVLEKVYVLIMISLRDFETKLNRTRSQNNSKLTIQTEGWLFGDSAVRIKEFRRARDYQSEYTQIIRQFQLLRQNLGYTHDNTVYESIQKELTTKERTEMKSGKIMDLTLEVTDGVSSSEEETTTAVENLEKQGSIIRSFQIGNVSDDEQEAFERVWNTDNKKRGYVIGSKVENLLPAVKEALKQYMSNVKI